MEVIVCSVVTPNHVFLQQPTHPTFPSLERQNYHMRMCYSVENVPHLPRPIDGTVFEYLFSYFLNRRFLFLTAAEDIYKFFCYLRFVMQPRTSMLRYALNLFVHSTDGISEVSHGCTLTTLFKVTLYKC